MYNLVTIECPACESNFQAYSREGFHEIECPSCLTDLVKLHDEYQYDDIANLSGSSKRKLLTVVETVTPEDINSLRDGTVAASILAKVGDSSCVSLICDKILADPLSATLAARNTLNIENVHRLKTLFPHNPSGVRGVLELLAGPESEVKWEVLEVLAASNAEDLEPLATRIVIDYLRTLPNEIPDDWGHKNEIHNQHLAPILGTMDDFVRTAVLALTHHPHWAEYDDEVYLGLTTESKFAVQSLSKDKSLLASCVLELVLGKTDETVDFSEARLLAKSELSRRGFVNSSPLSELERLGASGYS